MWYWRILLAFWDEGVALASSLGILPPIAIAALMCGPGLISNDKASRGGGGSASEACFHLGIASLEGPSSCGIPHHLGEAPSSGSGRAEKWLGPRLPDWPDTGFQTKYAA